MFSSFFHVVFWALLLVSFNQQLISKVQAAELNNVDFQKTKPVSNQVCTSCHQQQQHSWQESDHAKAMAIADKNSVLGNFDNVNVEHYGQKAFFFIKNEQYQVTVSYDDKSDTYPVKYTFGHFPLQQYLVETETGKLQVLPFAWDSRVKADGGQRWYHNYSNEEIRPQDRLHWRQPLQNWNGMCADCHSDGLKRNYNLDKNSFSSKWDNINVGCLSCHGNMTTHAKESAKTASSVKRNVSKDITSSAHPTGQWLRAIGQKTASWQGKKRDNSFMDTCFACHSLRAPLTDGINPSRPFLDQFSPQLLAAPLYHADGQIKEEVYVYGSFLQSKMFAAGVNCLDCHDKHTMKVKTLDNGLCLQCHGSDVYNVKSHHQHQEDSTGALCANCHMPTNRYMGVDDRRDHSFKIPRPDLSSEFDTPNACTSCHDDKNNQWASDNLKKWHGKPKALPNSKQFLMRLNSGQGINLEDHLTIITDKNLAVINRATAIQQLAYTTQTITSEILGPLLTDKENLIRLSAASAATLLPPTDRVALLVPLLTDKFRAIRVAAARSLVDSQVSAVDQAVFALAFKELQQSNDISSWRGEGRMNLGINALQSGDTIAAEKAFKATIVVEPYFDTGYINLADLYRSLQRPAQVSSVLMKGMKNLPKSGAIKYSYGLHLVRQKTLPKAVSYFSQAMLLSPENSQYAYTYILAMDGTGQSAQALSKLKLLIINYPDNGQLQELGLYLSQKLNSKADYDWFRTL
ncbi:multiheme c-type cytochrome [Colwellia piezophila]|uniref:multiheme c-type cytochrome n=1 Tax=Colwellia piezophila TaxID=211668 RepID=UPI00037A1258|nr:multiheme c-type cytochrome [Colwellia piezophila]